MCWIHWLKFSSPSNKPHTSWTSSFKKAVITWWENGSKYNHNTVAAVLNSKWQFCDKRSVQHPRVFLCTNTPVHLNVQPDMLFWARWLMERPLWVPHLVFVSWVWDNINVWKVNLKKKKKNLELFNIEVKWRLTVSTSPFDYMSCL